jgi:hypothetical protein
MFCAVQFITAGILLILNNFNILPWSIWQDLFPFWPVLIIFAGIDMLFGKSVIGKVFAGVINTVIFLAIIAKVVGLDLPYLRNIPLPQRQTSPKPLLFTYEHNVGDRFNNFDTFKYFS